MEPNFCEGDHVLTVNWRSVSKGDVVVFKYLGMIMIKKVDKIKGDFVYVSGDNKEKSSKLPAIKLDQVIGKVIFKY